MLNRYTGFKQLYKYLTYFCSMHLVWESSPTDVVNACFMTCSHALATHQSRLSAPSNLSEYDEAA